MATSEEMKYSKANKTSQILGNVRKHRPSPTLLIHHSTVIMLLSLMSYYIRMLCIMVVDVGWNLSRVDETFETVAGEWMAIATQLA